MTKARQAAYLDYRLGALIRSTYAGWNEYPLEQRRAFVEQYRRLIKELATVTGKNPPRITPPWTGNEIDMYGYDLELDPTPLESAVRVTERTLRKYGKLPATLTSHTYTAKCLDDVEHGRTLAELEATYTRYPTTT